MKSERPIPDATRNAILECAWRLMERSGRVDLSLVEIAREAGVSRQTLYLAFGGRGGLLVAMTDWKDASTDHVARIVAARQAAGGSAAGLHRYVDAWLDYLPEIYPVGILLDAASLTDEDAARVWNARLIGAVRNGFALILRDVAAKGGLPCRWSAGDAADAIWSAVHPTAWRRLVVERGWSPDAFRALAHDVVDRLLLAP